MFQIRIQINHLPQNREIQWSRFTNQIRNITININGTRVMCPHQIGPTLQLETQFPAAFVQYLFLNHFLNRTPGLRSDSGTITGSEHSINGFLYIVTTQITQQFRFQQFDFAQTINHDIIIIITVIGISCPPKFVL